MVSTQLRHFEPNFDELIAEEDSDFLKSGLKVTSIIRIGRLAVVEEDTLLGRLGEVSPERLNRMTSRLASRLIGDR